MIMAGVVNNMPLFNMISQWINIIGLYLIIDGILLYSRKRTPKYAQERVAESEMDNWRRIRTFAHIMMAFGFYIFTFTRNLPMEAVIAFFINIVGLLLIFAGQIISIRNNINKMGKWSATI